MLRGKKFSITSKQSRKSIEALLTLMMAMLCLMMKLLQGC